MRSINKNTVYMSKQGDFGKWEEQCLPIGNSFMGASFFGGISREKVVLNEKSFWSGGPSEYRPNYNGGNFDGRYEYVKTVQKLLAENKYNEAVELLPMLTGDGDGFGSYLLLCNAFLDFDNIVDENTSDYCRWLSLDDSLYGCDFKAGNIAYNREAFASYPDRVICIKLSASEKEKICFKLSLDSIQYNGKITVENDSLKYFGKQSDNGMEYCSVFKIVSTGGEIYTENEKLCVKNADEAVIYFAAATDYENIYPTYRSGISPESIVLSIIENSVNTGYEKLKERHTKDYKSLFDRVDLSLGHDEFVPCAVDEMLKAYRESGAFANQLEMLYFQYGRYLLISSSREGTLPANLQGVWNESNTPPWCCDYHINVNLQMNYWGAYNTNLAETAIPLVDFLEGLRKPGRKTAKEYFGIESTAEEPESGWTAHTQSSPFGWTAPGWDFYWGWSTAAGAWLMQNIWEHYEFTGDREYLEEKIYPIMRESAVFYKKWLVYDEKQDRLVSTPTYSPEHGPVSIGNTYEQSLIGQFFKDFVAASEVLGKDKALREEISAILPKLKPFSIGKTGKLKEWFEEDEENFDMSKVDPHHRHISHLMGLYPGKAITSHTPEYMKAAIETLNGRGDWSTGWARAYKINLWARTGDGNRTYSLLRGLLTDCTFDNLFDFHPPFQIDGNFGASAGICEMLIQSHTGHIKLLPSCPDNWENGEFKGLCARGGFVVDLSWKNKKPIDINILSKNGGVCRIEYPVSSIKENGIEITFNIENEITLFDTKPNTKYIIK